MTTTPDIVPTDELFAQHEVNVQQRRLPDVIAARMRRTGLVTVSGLTSPEIVASFADRVMYRTVYAGDGPLGLHEMRDTGEHAHLVGRAELTRAALDVHTYRADLIHPPQLVLMACGRTP
ncbi:hypothetical protein ACWD4B_11790 [Streptomyces sp. NPDC002536]